MRIRIARVKEGSEAAVSRKGKAWGEAKRKRRRLGEAGREMFLPTVRKLEENPANTNGKPRKTLRKAYTSLRSTYKTLRKAHEPEFPTDFLGNV